MGHEEEYDCICIGGESGKPIASSSLGTYQNGRKKKKKGMSMGSEITISNFSDTNLFTPQNPREIWTETVRKTILLLSFDRIESYLFGL